MRGPVKIINRKNDLKRGYLIRLELGIIASLLILISAFKINIQSSGENDQVTVDRQEEVFMEEIVQTKQELKAPPPPRPVVPVEVPNDEIIENEIIDLDSELDMDTGIIDMPPPPPKFEEEEEEEIFVIVEQMPELVGGLASIQKHIQYPELARKAGIEGRVVLQFIIDENGNVNNPVVVRGIGGGCDEEALKAVQKHAKFVPGRQRGKPVRVRYSLPITFKLDRENQ
ncbi:MAG: energy transducer TonB [Balneola sp.]|nr:energy transducer TonB [Balneola sp.]|tara:strand:- start:25529 stop:26212 length:684 start_codon:yes stop_codon:yes gene_type:complete